MYDLEFDLAAELKTAWKRVRPKLLRDPLELARRKARRRMNFMQHPPRAWCLAVRAAESRINACHFLIAPSRYEAPIPGTAEWKRIDHDVTLTAKKLRWLCRPVPIPFPGLTWREAAAALGVDRAAIRAAINRGYPFSVRYIKGLNGGRGPDVPILNCADDIDPASFPLGNKPGPEWATYWRYLSSCIPDDLHQTLTRRATYRPYRGQMKFRGWRWLCPGCNRETTRVFYPLPAIIAARPIVAFARHHFADDPIEPPLPTFACSACHKINDEGRLRSQGWDTLIAHLTAGLLYGREVKKPKWYTPVRKKQYKPRPSLPRSQNKDRVLEMLLTTDLDTPQIAKILRLNPNSVAWWISRIYQNHNVKSRQQLRAAQPAHEASTAKAAS